jgi:hypothetical protein
MSFTEHHAQAVSHHLLSRLHHFYIHGFTNAWIGAFIVSKPRKYWHIRMSKICSHLESFMIHFLLLQSIQYQTMTKHCHHLRILQKQKESCKRIYERCEHLGGGRGAVLRWSKWNRRGSVTSECMGVARCSAYVDHGCSLSFPLSGILRIKRTSYSPPDMSFKYCASDIAAPVTLCPPQTLI